MDNHTVLKNNHKGQDIYVIGSGASMDHVSPGFFDGKLTIATCQVWKKFPGTYVIHKHAQFIPECVKAGQTTVVSKHDCGDIDHGLNDATRVNYVFTHKRGRFGDLEKNFVNNLEAIGKDEDIFVSYSTITSAIHLAAYMGAKNIILCGHDCGWLDGKSHFGDYAERIKAYHESLEAFNKNYKEWFKRIEQDTIRLKAKLKEVYRCNIYSLNPFINLGLEGHKLTEDPNGS